MFWPVLGAYLFIITFGGVAAVTKPVRIGVYYETRCPDSIHFFNDQLMPTYARLKSNVSIELVPYGKATHRRDPRSGQWRIHCQHGSEECRGNTLQACALQRESSAVALDFVACMMRLYGHSSSAQRCAKSSGVNATALVQCAEGAEGKRLLRQMGEKTSPQRLTFVPHVTIDGRHSNMIEHRALSDLFTLVCDSYSDSSVPAACE